jgi:hypothetical protein
MYGLVERVDDDLGFICSPIGYVLFYPSQMGNLANENITGLMVSLFHIFFKVFKEASVIKPFLLFAYVSI